MGGIDFTGDAAGNAVARAMAGNALTQGIAVATGLQPRFSWSNVAIAAVSAGVGFGVSKELNSTSFNNEFGSYASLARSTISGFVAGMTVNALRGGQQTAIQVATDDFGKALGDSLGTSLKPTGQQTAVLQQAAQTAQYDWYDAGEPVQPNTPASGNSESPVAAPSGNSNVPATAAAPAEEESAPPAETSSARTVTVRKGDTLTKLAGTNDPATLDKIAQFNGLRSRHEVPAGMTLTRLARTMVEPGATIMTDENGAYNVLSSWYDHRCVEHSVEFSTIDGVNENQAESFFSRLRRAEYGTYHGFRPKYLMDYAQEFAWREDVRRTPELGKIKDLTTRVFGNGLSRWWRGYWQGHHRAGEYPVQN